MRADSARPTVLMVASFSDSILSFRGALVDAWLASGRDVCVAAPGLDAGSPVARELLRRGARVASIDMHRTGRNPLADLATMLQLYRLMRAIRPEFLLAYTAKPVVYGLLAGWLAGIPHRYALITGLGYAFQAEGNARRGLRGVLQRLYGLALGKAEKVLFQNGDDRSLFLRLGVVDPDAATAVVDGSGIDVDAYRPMPVPPGAPSFLMVARLLGDKGVREYAAAARIVRQRYPGTTCALAGWLDEGNPDSIARAELESWVQAGDIDYLGRLSDVRPALAACSVYVLPSYREGMPRTVLEAMASARAIITTDVPGCRETVVAGENGFLVSARAHAPLADAMCRFLDEPGLAASMGASSRGIAERRFDVRRINEKMLREMGMEPGMQEEEPAHATA